MDWFLYDRDLRHERVKAGLNYICSALGRGVGENFPVVEL